MCYAGNGSQVNKTPAAGELTITPLTALERQKGILTLLKQKRRVSVADLSGRFGLSAVTIRASLSVLEQRGLLMHDGEAIALDASTSALAVASVASSDCLHRVITDEGTPAAMVEALRDRGIEVILV